MAPVCSVSAAAALMVPFRVRVLLSGSTLPGALSPPVFQNVLAIRAGNGLAADRKRIIFHIGVASAANGTVRADSAHTNRQVMGIDRQRVPLFLRPLKLDLFQICAPKYKGRIQSCHTGRNGDALQFQASKKAKDSMLVTLSGTTTLVRPLQE